MIKFKEFLLRHKKTILITVIILLLVTALLLFILLRPRADKKTASSKNEQSVSQISENTMDEDSNAASSSESLSSVRPSSSALSSIAEGPSKPVSHAPSNTAESHTQAGDSQNTIQSSIPVSSNEAAYEHQHDWQAHTAQKWVSDIVTVIDEPEQTISGAKFYTMHENGEYVADGPVYWLEDGFTQDDLKEIIREGILNADENGLYNGVYYGNYQNVSKTIPAVTYQEDQGHYESYIDYYYCACGARK